MEDDLRNEIKAILASGAIEEIVKSEIERFRAEMAETQSSGADSDQTDETIPISRSIQENRRNIQAALFESPDLVIREFTTGYKGARRGMII